MSETNPKNTGKNNTGSINPFNIDEIITGAVVAATALIVEGVLLRPEQDVNIVGTSVHVKGPGANVQKLAASAVRTYYDTVLPKVAGTASKLLDKTKLEPKLRDLVVNFVYDGLEEYNLGTGIDALYDKVSPNSKNDIVKSVDKFVGSLVDAEDGRDKLAKDITNNIIKAGKTLTDGTVFSFLMSDDIIKPVKDFIKKQLDGVLKNEGTDSTMDSAVGFIDKARNLSVGTVLEDRFGLDKQGMADYIDQLYDRYLGEERIKRMEEEQKGSRLYDEIMDMDFDDFAQMVRDDYMEDILRFSKRAAGIGITAYGAFGKGGKIYKIGSKMPKLRFPKKK